MARFTQDLKSYLKPFWMGNTVENETFMFVGEADRGVFLYKPKKILSVKDYYLEKDFVLNEDYLIEGRSFRRSGEKIPYWKEDEYYCDRFEIYKIGAKKEICERFGGQRFLKYGEGNTFTQKQIAVSYTHEDGWNGPVPVGKSEKFACALKKIKSGETCRFLFYGDSITTGCNASGTPQGGMTSPFMPPFPELIRMYLNDEFSAKIESVNTAVGGMDTAWGLENVEERVIAYKPDLVFLAFGMNDPKTPIEQYASMIRETIEKIHTALPQTEILTISSILPNDEADGEWFANQRLFHQELTKIEEEYSFVGTANVTEMQEYILKTGKRYRDMTANNINHPNDFGHRLYAQVILTTLLGQEFKV